MIKAIRLHVAPAAPALNRQSHTNFSLGLLFFLTFIYEALKGFKAALS